MYISPILNVDHRTYKTASHQEAIAVDGVSIDDYVDARFLVDFIKMDIQGYELNALRGMERTIRANPGMIICSEFWPYGFRLCGTHARCVYDYIRSLNLQMWLPAHGTLRPVSPTTLKEFQDVETVYYNVILSKEPII
jgi:hypothetical protein